MGRVNVYFDDAAARKNGALQIFVGAVCIVFNAAILVVMAVAHDWLDQPQRTGPGIWAGIFYVATGVVTLVAGRGRTTCLIVSALTLNVVSGILNVAHVIVMGISILSEDRHRFHGWNGYHTWRYPVYVSLFSVSLVFAFVETVLLIRGVVLTSEAIYWRRLADRGAVEKETAEGTKQMKESFNHAFATMSARVNGVAQIGSALVSAGVNIAAICIFVNCLNHTGEHMGQTNGTAIIAAPFFIMTGYFAVTSASTSSNRRIVAFLCLSTFCCLIAFLEGGGSCYALSQADFEMKVAPVKECVTKPDRWGNNRTECNRVSAPNADRYLPLLVSLHAVVLLMALFHLGMSIWGVVIGSMALHKDQTCIRFCSNCCIGCSNCAPLTSEACERCCLPGAAAAPTAHYQPIQFVVQHQGMTTTADGQQALVVLLPMNDNMNVAMEKAEGGEAVVSLGEGQAGIKSKAIVT